jgi:phosphoglucomutase
MEVIRDAGSSPIRLAEQASRSGGRPLTSSVVYDKVDPTFRMSDRDGENSMDCSSPCAMAKLIGLSDRFDIACGNHGGVTHSAG